MSNPEIEKTDVDESVEKKNSSPVGAIKKNDKQKVLGEVFSDQSLENFIAVRPVAGEPIAFTRMRQAYQSLPEPAFERFCELVLNRGLPVNPEDANGSPFLEFLNTHPAQNEYAQALQRVMLG